MATYGLRPRAASRGIIVFKAAALLLRLILGPLGAARRRARIRHDLRRLAQAEDHILRDVGVTRMEVERLASARSTL